jgi:signal transduction histidine kinase
MERITPHLGTLFVAVFAVEMQREVLFQMHAPVREHVAAALLGVAATVALALRKRFPLPGYAVVTLVALGTVLLDSHGDALWAPLFAPVLASYAVGQRVDGRPLAWAIAAGVVLSIVAITLQTATTSPLQYVTLPLLQIAAPVVLGRMMRDRAAMHAALLESTRSAEAQRDARSAEAVLDERARIAGELHDVIAHALSAMVVQAGGARRLVDRDPAAAATAFAAVEDTGRDALTEIRSLLGVLRRDDEEIALAPQPSLQHIESLVRRAELPVALTVDGEQRPLPAGVDLTAYRVVQEALTAARAADAAGAEVKIGYRPSRVELEISDDGRGDRPPLVTAERVALYGGELAGGGRLVRVRLPLGEPA